MIGMDKQYRTRDGKAVRIYATHNGVDRISKAVHGAILIGGEWIPKWWWAHGGRYSYPHMTHSWDLIEVKPRIKRTIWINILPERASLKQATMHYSKEEANEWRHPDALACIPIEIDCEEGEGLGET